MLYHLPCQSLCTIIPPLFFPACTLSAFFCEYDAGCCPGAAYLSMETCASTGKPQAVSTVTSAASNIYQTNKAETRNHDNANCVPLRS